MRVLHLLDRISPQASVSTLALMAQLVGRLGRIEQQVGLIGPPAMGRAAARAGIDGAVNVSAPFGHVLSFWRVPKRWADVDLVHCWSISAFTAASMRWRGRAKALTLTAPPSKRAAHWLRMLCTDHGERTILLPISSTIRRDLLAGGVPEPMVHVLRPGLDMGAVPHQKRDALRQRWGIEDDRTKVVVLLTDPPTAGDAFVPCEVVNRVNDSFEDIASAPVRLLVHPRQRNRLRAVRMWRGLGRSHWLITDAALDEPWQVLPGCDMALAMGPHAGNLSLLWAMAANVPIVGEATYATSEIVEDRHSALLTKPGEAHQLGHRIRQLVDDPQLAWQIRDAARHEAYSFFSRQHYCKRVQVVYKQLIAGRAVEVPQLEVTGGLRFTGRA